MRNTLAATVTVAFTLAAPALAQQGPPNGMRPADLRTHAITNATVIPSPGEMIEDANILIRDGVIVAVGPASEVQVPAGAWVWPADGLTVYSGLIEPALMVAPGDRASSAGAHWNPQITPEIRMSEQPPPSGSARRELRSLGFTTAAVYPSSGILRGTGNVIALAENDEHVLAYRESSFMAAGFDTGGRRGGGGYPGSLMGAIALLRQTMYDAQWHAATRRMYEDDPTGLEPPIRADALVALDSVIAKRQAVLFDASDELNALRAARLAEEFDLNMILLGSGFEFRRLREIAALDMTVIVPLRYPERPNVNTLAMADRTSLRDMMTWEQAPTNARRLLNEGVEIALTTHRLRRKNEFYNALRSAIENGLTEDQALAALTTTPARLLGIDDKVGRIAPGMAANLVVVNGGLFEKDAKVRDVWVNGRRNEISADPDITFIGKGILKTSLGHEFEMEFDSVRRTVSISLGERRRLRARNVTVQRDHISFITDAQPFVEGAEGFARLSGAITGGVVAGTGVLPDGSEFTFTIEPTELRPPQDAPDAAADEQQDQGDAPKDDAEDDPVAGTWSVLVTIEGMDDPLPVELTLKREADGSLTGTSTTMGMSLDVSNVTFDKATGELRYDVETPGGVVTITGIVDGDEISGRSTGAGMASTFRGSRTRRGATAVAAADEPKLPPAPEELVFPLGEYGFAEPPNQETLLIRGATIWTSGPAGIIEEGDLFIEDGRIKYVGPTTNWAFGPGDEPRIINARGRHITPGLLDCHSHTGISGGVNEFTHVNTAEVRIGDVIDPDDINWYRQLAGGLTAANQLHGSANPIGGQNSIVKLKWGAAEGAEAMRVKDARPGIKFALGENVVRSTTRYPNTRMGVETVMRDAFTAAREYEARLKRPNVQTSKRPKAGVADDSERVALSAVAEIGGENDAPVAEKDLDVWTFGRLDVYPVRRDLQLDALVEILNDERDIHCHSYRQDEILMLMRVAEDLGFRVATFQHILEGYKVAEVMKAHGAHGSAFSDWWAYKVEVMDAIPHAGALMHHVGVNVSFNSDSSELARRMNTEASKAVRYGGVSPHEALKFVTINPAIQMGIDHRTGSLEVGKDADFVIWSGDPLSTYTRAEQTWIEGAMYFCLEKDQELRRSVQSERQRLIQKILTQAHGAGDRGTEASRDRGAPAEDRPRGGRRPRLMETVMDQHIRALENMVRLGINPDEIRPGECGCNEWWFGLR